MMYLLTEGVVKPGGEITEVKVDCLQLHNE